MERRENREGEKGREGKIKEKKGKRKEGASAHHYDTYRERET